MRLLCLCGQSRLQPRAQLGGQELAQRPPGERIQIRVPGWQHEVRDATLLDTGLRFGRGGRGHDLRGRGDSVLVFPVR